MGYQRRVHGAAKAKADAIVAAKAKAAAAKAKADAIVAAKVAKKAELTEWVRKQKVFQNAVVVYKKLVTRHTKKAAAHAKAAKVAHASSTKNKAEAHKQEALAKKYQSHIPIFEGAVKRYTALIAQR